MLRKNVLTIVPDTQFKFSECFSFSFLFTLYFQESYMHLNNYRQLYFNVCLTDVFLHQTVRLFRSETNFIWFICLCFPNAQQTPQDRIGA